MRLGSRFIRALGAAGTALFVVGSAAGCSPGEAPQPVPTIDARILAAAREQGASDEQLSILESGAVEFEEYQEAVDRSLTCMRDAGIEVFDDSVTSARGFPEISYSFATSSAGRSDDQTLAIADACLAQHSLFVEQAYQLSPASIEQQEAAFGPYRDVVITCLAENGGEVRDDATMPEVLGAAADLESRSGVDCVSESGYGR
ncbi:hypothetical protein FH969_10690 [Miniimonas arenae]|uniref:Lipoprotein n=1 Tax=Miniimonas arenae TaxID=676201 RepID=A0A5C5BBY6_9MICO|nr:MULTISPECIES: hypothetical protein [Miniimonas]TNU73582.1 hypothetical protein FH969_10690 [Miniimonas arenae]